MRQLINSYRKLSKPTKASLWFVISNVLLKGISFFTLPIFSHMLTTSEYGVVSVYNSWVSTIAIVSTLTIWGGGFNVGMVKYEDDYKKMISSFQGLAIFITLLFMITSLFFLNSLSSILGISKFLVICMYLEILAQIPFNIWSTKQRYRYEYKKLIIITLIIAVFSPLLGVLCVNNTIYKAEARIVSNLAINLLIGISLFVTTQMNGRKFFSRKYWHFGFRFNIVLIPHYLSTQILNQADRIMINSLCGSSDAGIYSVAYNFALLLNLVTSGINSSLTPHIYQCMKIGKTYNLKKETTIIVLFVAVISIAIICFVPDLFIFMLPNSYYPALKIIPPVTVGAFFLFLYPLFGSVEFYYEENKYVTYASVIGAILNVLLNVIFIKLFGFIAAAYTTLICYMGFCICHYFFMIKVLKRNHKKNDIYDIKTISVISICLFFFSIIMVSLYDYVFVRWGVILFIVVVMIIKRKQLLYIYKEYKKEL